MPVWLSAGLWGYWELRRWWQEQLWLTLRHCQDGLSPE